MPILTPRLILRPPRPGEGAMLNTAILESFDTLNRFMPWAKEKPSLDDSEVVVRKAFANWILKRNEDPDLMLFILDRKTKDLIGASGFYSIDWEVPCIETGYWVRSKYSNQGFITEALNAITQYAFKVIKAKRITITCDTDNEKSKKIPEKLGYKLESIMKSNRIKIHTGEVSDTLVLVRNDLLNLPEIEVSWGNQLNE